MSARDDVLARVRSALSAAPAPPPSVRAYRTTGRSGPVLLDLLEERLLDYQARVRRTASEDLPAAVAAALADVMSSGQRTRLVIPAGIDRSWVAGLDADVVVDDGLSAAELDEIDAVLTASRVAVAETGTIVLDAAADQGRLAISLVPDRHVCVVRAESVVETVPQAVRLLAATRPLTWISGPSATSDIELVRVDGVHGPRTLDVILVD